MRGVTSFPSVSPFLVAITESEAIALAAPYGEAGVVTIG